MKKLIKTLGIVIGILLLSVVVLFGFLTITEYKPEAKETLVVSGEASESLKAGDSLKVISWNIGYGALGDNADFFMDGGSSVKTADKDRVETNLSDICKELQTQNPDLILLQETDKCSSRSSRIDETAAISSALASNGMSYQTTFANNFKVAFIPYPLPPIGKVDSGLYTLSKFKIHQAERIQLPIPFTWPVRMGNLKRCLSVNRIPVTGSDKELVVVNLHLEAYDSGEGKIAQTKMLKEFLESEAAKKNYVIAAGDFNQTFSNIDTSMYPAFEGKWQCGKIDVSEFDEGLHFLMDNSAPTCRSLDQSYADYTGEDADFQFYMIDGFIVSDNVKVNSLTTLDLGFKATDHNPVAAELTLE